MSVEIREAGSDDAKALSDLLIELGYELCPEDVRARIEEYGSDSDSVLVAHIADEVVGFISFHVIPLFHASGSMGRITAMCVSSRQRRKGIGQALLAAIEEVAVDQGCRKMEVTSGDHRVHNAHVFYESCGYKCDCRRFQKTLSQGDSACTDISASRHA